MHHMQEEALLMMCEFARAGVISATTAAERSGFDTYHVVNPHWSDGVSLDRIVDWAESAGYPVSLTYLATCLVISSCHPLSSDLSHL